MPFQWSFLFKSAFIIALGIFLLPRRWKGYASLVPILLLVISSTFWAIEALLDGSQQIDLFKSFWSGDLVLVVDRMSAFFILIINLTCVTGIIYSLGYTKHYLDKKGAISISLHFYSFVGLQFAMLLVVMLRDGFAFLVAWELMSLFSFCTRDFWRRKEATLKTGITYLVQMHMGFTLLLIAFLFVNNQSGAFGFDALQVYFSQHRNFWLFLFF